MTNIPMFLTWLRILAIPVLIVAFYMPGDEARFWATIVFMVAAWTDWLDGYLARKWNQTSGFGAFLDPVADKLIVAVALVMLAIDLQTLWVTIPVLVIISREIIISALREWMATEELSASVAVSNLGKWKTATQLGAITFLLYGQDFYGIPLKELGLVLLLVATALTLVSMMQYLNSAIKAVKEKNA